ncbi:MAG: Flp pilus assembly complex ATPase component TadA [Nitrospirae bacterium]|nr:Flp pilus assembly complex ATPase component TadA [Nitrospirota bacterium]MBI3594320.1 Flp pilus assembly complex ATPase component TadA [Nitrospirota bacterium]
MRIVPKSSDSIVKKLIEKGWVKEETIQTLFPDGVGGKNINVVEELLKSETVSQEQMATLFSELFQLPYEPLKDFRMDQKFFQTIPVELMYRYPFVPFEENDGILTIVISNPIHASALDELELVLNKSLKFKIGTRQSILDTLKKSEGSSQVLRKIEEDFKPQLIRETDEGEESLSIEKLSKDSSPVIRLVDTIILTALQKRASDIHIEASDRQVEVKYRIDGALYQAMEPLDAQFHAPLISRIKVMSELDIAERRVPQDGRFKLKLDNKKVDFRVSILPSIFGEDVVIRILDKEYIATDINELRLERLGFNPGDLKKFRKAIIEPYGMVLVTGPTGSGKTTTLYAAITEIKSSEDKFITIEDPVEYQLGHVVQIPVNEKKGLTFARGLRSILRHDPDKIMVGEIRDAETAQIAIQSALTGHLVFTTVHANNAFDVVGRFTNMGIEPYNFVSSLNCILAQRLVRTLCMDCREEAPISSQLMEDSGLTQDVVYTHKFYLAKGCPECNGTGFKGRKAITEFLDLSDTIREMILVRRPASEIRKEAVKEGMTTLRQSGLEKVYRGETTLREINRVTFIE